jgi:hypothetical protein
MTTPTRSKKATPAATKIRHIETCGMCQFGHVDDDGDLLCYGSPPIMMFVEGDQVPVRGLPVLPNMPRCACFQPPVND